MLWSVAALALAAAMAPLFVQCCGSLSRLTARNAHRIVATARGSEELERLRTAGAAAAQDREFAVPELPGGRGHVGTAPGPRPGLRRVDLVLTWDERGVPGRAEWSTLVRAAEGTRP